MITELKKSLKILKKGGNLLYPTDTVWGIGCDASNFDAIQNLFSLKQRSESKSMICLVSDFNMLKQYVETIPEAAYNILEYATKPTTIIYDNPVNVAENLVANDNSLAIRIVHEDFCNQLIKKLGRPIVSTSANISGQPTPNSFEEISEDILKGVDYVVNLHNEKKSNEPSSVIKLSNDGVIKILRK